MNSSTCSENTDVRTSDALHRGTSFSTTEIQRHTYYDTKSLNLVDIWGLSLALTGTVTLCYKPLPEDPFQYYPRQYLLFTRFYYINLYIHVVCNLFLPLNIDIGGFK